MKLPALARAPDIDEDELTPMFEHYHGMLDLAFDARSILGDEFRFVVANPLNLLMDVQIMNRLYRFRSRLDQVGMYVLAEHGHIVFISRDTYRARKGKISH